MRRKPQHKALWGRSWDVLGRVWTLSGHSWGAFGRSWGALGALLGRSWALLGRSWGSLGAFWAPLGDLGRSWGVLGALLGRSWGAPWGILVGLGLDLGSILRRFLVELGAIWVWLFRLSLHFVSLSSCFELKKSCGKLGAAGQIWGKR